MMQNLQAVCMYNVECAMCIRAFLRNGTLKNGKNFKYISYGNAMLNNVWSSKYGYDMSVLDFLK